MKNLKNLGKALNKAEQKQINGGAGGDPIKALIEPIGNGSGTISLYGECLNFPFKPKKVLSTSLCSDRTDSIYGF